jgi:hypothetical protein
MCNIKEVADILQVSVNAAKQKGVMAFTFEKIITY